VVSQGASAVVLNMTAVNAFASGFATVFSCGQSWLEPSNLNHAAGQAIPNLVVAQVWRRRQGVHPWFLGCGGLHCHVGCLGRSVDRRRLHEPVRPGHRPHGSARRRTSFRSLALDDRREA